ncbi:neurotrypsin-like, partial [Saccostrea cucullata]|uniref:neurotrypsin-like n=1 Tax=Saccostrea cuccullata TaxID=36930 RepID=UPI002ED4035C
SDIDECENGPCKNNASCLDGIDTYKCQCYPGFYGENCTERNLVRLMDGSTPYEGRVEIFNDGVWGTVCDDHWDDKDAAVVCGMLGYSRNNAKGLCCEVYGKGGPQIWLDNVECLGTEQDIFHCQHIGWGNHNCDNHEDAAVVCSSNDKPIRLVGGQSQYEGRLEIYYNGEWGTVCDDYWDEKDTAMVCQSLGFSSKNAVSMCCARFGEGTGPILLDDVDCLGSETDIGQCKHRGWKVHNCQHLEDVSIRCSPKEDPSTNFSTTLTTNPRESTLQSTTPSPATTITTTPIMITTKDSDTTSITEISNKTIRLIGGATPYEGRVEVYYNGEWGTICDDGLENSGQGNWNNSFSKVICRSWDIPRTSSICTQLPTTQITGETTTPMTSTRVRLVGGSSPYEGRVEVYYNGAWGTICDDYYLFNAGGSNNSFSKIFQSVYISAGATITVDIKRMFLSIVYQRR